MVTMPVFSTYSKFCDTAIINRNNDIINNMVSKYNCQYKNYFTDQHFEIADFHDNDHLNYIGAAKFTRMLDTEFVKPLLSRQLK